MFTSNRIQLSTVFFCVAMTACHQDIESEVTSSATDDDDFFGTTSDDASDTEAVPTTSAGDPTDGGSGIDPSDFCKLHPSDDYPGFIYACGGKVRGGINFDYYGDPDLPINTYLICIDKTEPPLNLDMPEGYVYSCFVEASLEFDPVAPTTNGHKIDACCLRDSPFEATSSYCRVDAAEEFCFGASDGLNQLRSQLPVIPLLDEVNQQLENLNKFIADSSTQTECSQHLGKGFVTAGDFGGNVAEVSWTVEHPQALDPEVGWPWIRNIHANVYDLAIDSAENNGLSCSEIEGDAVTGAVGDGTLSVNSHLGKAATNASGRASFHRADCRLPSCEIKFETFELKVDDFAVGSLSFSDVSVSLAAPTVGLINDNNIAVRENQMHLTATFKLASEGRPQFGGAPVSVGLRNHGVAELRLLRDSSIAVKTLNVSQWPFTMTLVSEVSR